MSNHVKAQAHALHNLAVKLTTAHHAVARACEEERRCLREYLVDIRNDIAKTKWLRSCGVLAVAQMNLDRVVGEFSKSAALAKELAS